MKKMYGLSAVGASCFGSAFKANSKKLATSESGVEKFKAEFIASCTDPKFMCYAVGELEVKIVEYEVVDDD